jgi:hypothetical protein
VRRNLIAYREDVRNGAWQRAEQFCFFTHPIRDVEAMQILADQLIDNVEAFVAGEPRNVV